MAKFFNRTFINATDLFPWLSGILSSELNATIYYMNSEYFIFSIPSLQTKVIRIVQYNSKYTMTLDFGDTYTTGSTITGNLSVVSSSYNTTAPKEIYVVTSSDFLIIGSIGIDSRSTGNILYLFGTTTKNNSVILCFRNDPNPTDNRNYITSIYPYSTPSLSTFYNAFNGSASSICRQPIIIDVGGIVNVEGGEPEILRGVYNASFSTGNPNLYLITPTGWFSPSPFSYNARTKWLRTSIYVPF